MIRRDGIAEQGEHAGAADIANRIGIECHAHEIGRISHVSRVGIPGIDLTLGRIDAVPVFVTVEHARVPRLEHARVDVVNNGIMNFLTVRPDILEEYGLAISVFAQRIVEQVDIERTGQRVSDNQRRRGEEVHLHQWMDATFEVAIARQHAANDKLAVLHAFGNLR